MPASSPGWTGGEPADLTAWTLVRAYHLVGRLFYATLAPHGLNPQQFGVLIELVSRPGQSQASLARAVLATPQAIGGVLRAMEDRGLVERVLPPGRGRAAEVRASAEGTRLLDHVTPLVLEAVRPEGLGLDASRSRTLNALLHEVVASLEAPSLRTPAQERS